MKIDYQVLFRKLKKGEIAPLYLFAGPEEYLIEEGIRLIKEKIMAKGDEELNFDIMYGFDASIQTILEKVETAGFFGNKRLVVVHGVNSLKDKDKKLLISYCEDHSKTSCLVLVDEKIDSRNKLQSAFLTSGNAVISYFWQLYPNQVPSWIQERTKQKGKLISHECAEILQELTGNSLRSLDNEIEKLVIFIGGRKTIEEKDVVELISSGDIENIFKLSDAIGERRLDKALKIFNQIKNKGDDFMAVLGLLIRHFRIIWQVKEMDEEGISPLEISKIIKMNPTFIKNYLQEMKNFTWDGLRDIFKRMLQADFEIKRGISKPEIAFESLLISFSK